MSSGGVASFSQGRAEHDPREPLGSLGRETREQTSPRWLRKGPLVACGHSVVAHTTQLCSIDLPSKTNDLIRPSGHQHGQVTLVPPPAPQVSAGMQSAAGQNPVPQLHSLFVYCLLTCSLQIFLSI